MRKYQPIWDALKLNSTTALEADLSLHSRIIKAVIKEKHRDLGWKVLCSERGNSYRLAYQVEGLKITFSLEADNSIRNL